MCELACSMTLRHPDPWDLSPVLAQKLKNRDVTNTLQQLPLLTAMEEESSGGISGSLVKSILQHILW